MIKRDKIKQVVITGRVKNKTGGFVPTYQDKDYIDACVSTATSYADMTQYNLKEERVIHVVTNTKLIMDQDTRYEFDGILYQVRHQAQKGIEFFSTLVETPN